MLMSCKNPLSQKGFNIGINFTQLCQSTLLKTKLRFLWVFLTPGIYELMKLKAVIKPLHDLEIKYFRKRFK